MNAPSDLPNKKPEPNDSHAGFFKADLALCFTFVQVAETNFKIGNSKSADRAIRRVQAGWNAAHRLLSDPAHAKHLTDEEIQDITAELGRLRARIDELRQRFRK
jgi:hypothetical protein